MFSGAEAYIYIKYQFISCYITLSIFLYVLTPEGDIRRVPGNQVMGVSFVLFLLVLCNVSSVSSE